MLKEMILFIKYPYTAGVIATFWLASAILMAIERDLDGIKIVMINTLLTVVVAMIGFGGKED